MAVRLVAALLHIIKHIERMGDQCVNMAKLVPLAGHEPPSGRGILSDIQRMGAQARRRSCSAAGVRAARHLAQDLVRQDDEIDRLNRRCSTSRWRSATTPTRARVGDA